MPLAWSISVLEKAGEARSAATSASMELRMRKGLALSALK
jgi:hypothetical protein